MPKSPATGMPSAFNDLSLQANPTKPTSTSTSKPKQKPKQKQSEEIADSWDQESDSSDRDQPSSPPTQSHTSPSSTSQPSRHSQSSSQPDTSTLTHLSTPHAALSYTAPPPQPRQRDPNIRPEKTTASASRLIAGALGVRAPKRTEEQRAYDKAVRETEKKRRDKEREDKVREEEEKVRARAAVWDD